MTLKPNNPGCNCCGPDCVGCENITELLVSGLGGTFGNCNSYCASRNGTYFFRAPPWSGPSTACGAWTRLLSNSNCGVLPAYPEDRYEIGAWPGCTSWGWSVSLGLISGVLTARVTLLAVYSWHTDADESSYQATIRTQYAFEWLKTSENCEGLLGELPLTNVSQSICRNDPSSDTRFAPDVCDTVSATIILA